MYIQQNKCRKKEAIGRMKGNKKHLVFGVCICVAFVLLGAFAGVGAASARTIYVPDNYAKIQDAVNAASIGDTIIVRDGTYYENLKVDKQLTIKSENSSANCIVDCGGSGDVITLNADGRTLVVNQTDACTTGDLYFSTISDAVMNANDSDTIIVCPGTYNENVDVDVSVKSAHTRRILQIRL